MGAFPDDIFTEPSNVDPDTLANLGPLRAMAGVWEGRKGVDHGLDADANGVGSITTQRLYQLVRQHVIKDDRVFQIEFLDAGAEAFTFTFG